MFAVLGTKQSFIDYLLDKLITKAYDTLNKKLKIIKNLKNKKFSMLKKLLLLIHLAVCTISLTKTTDLLKTSNSTAIYILRK